MMSQNSILCRKPATAILMILATGLVVLSVAANAAAQDKPQPLKDATIKFNTLDKMPWKQIIESYAGQANLSLQLRDQPPTGTFDYEGEREMNLLEALDFLNQMLILNDRVLIRNRDLLILFDLTKGIPEDIIETVTPDELDLRGKYEILKCEYDITGLDAPELSSQISPMIAQHHRNKLAVIPMANKLVVQETGQNLRWIRGIVEAARSVASGQLIETIFLQHITMADVMAYANILQIDPNTMQSEDGDLRLASPFGDKIVAMGKPKRVAMFMDFVKKIDVPVTPRNLQIEKPFFEAYTVTGKAELIHGVVQTLLAGQPDVRLDFDDSTNKIFLMGRQADHQAAIQAINKTQGTSQELAVIWLKESDVADVIDKIRDMIPEPETETEESLKLVEQSQNRLMALGKPSEVALVRKIVEQIDIPFVSPTARRPNRFISMDSHEIDQTMEYFEAMWPTSGYSNQIRIITPDQRNLMFNNRRKVFEISPRSQNEPTPQFDDRRRTPETDSQPDTRTQRRQGELRSDRNRDQSNYRFRPSDAARDFTYAVVNMGNPNRFLQQSNGTQDNGTAKTSEQQGEDKEEFQSVPGAPVTIRITNFGISLDSKDLEALDAIEALIMNNLDSGSVVGPMELFQLKYRDANEAKEMLENYLGMSSGGGGGGGLGGLMGGALQNAVGGAAGNMLGGLLGGAGGGGGAGSGVYETEGDVSIVADANHYTLLVSATQNDMAVIRDFIDLIDQPSAMHNPNIAGETRTIQILHQDPVKVEELVRQSLGILLRSTEQGGQQQQNNAAAQQAQMLRALMGGGRRGGGGGAGGGTEIEVPKASLSVDERNSQLVVTGPDFIYQTIYQFVEQIDVPNTRPMPKMETLPINGRMDLATLKTILQGLNDPNIQLIDDADPNAAGGTNSRGNARGAQPGSPAAAAAQMQNMRNLQQMMQRGGGRGGGTRGGGRGGGTRGGGTRGGGNRGGRGG